MAYIFRNVLVDNTFDSPWSPLLIRMIHCSPEPIYDCRPISGLPIFRPSTGVPS